MSDISPKPWSSWDTGIDDNNGKKIFWNENTMSYDNQNHIVMCVNKYDGLVADVENKNIAIISLEGALVELHEEVERLKQENGLLLTNHETWKTHFSESQKEIRQLKEYIKIFGWCGYHGLPYHEAKQLYNIDCFKCFDNAECDRYRLIGGGTDGN